MKGADELLTRGYSIAKHGTQWRAEYKNSAGQVNFVGEFASQDLAKIGIVIWSQSVRFDDVIARYKNGDSVRQIAAHYGIADRTISQALQICGVQLKRMLASARAKRWAK